MFRTVLTAATLAVASIAAQASPLSYGVIMGSTLPAPNDTVSSISNADFTVTSQEHEGNTVELALRARERYPTPTNNTNYDGIKTYQQAAGTWNFDFSIMSGEQALSFYTYSLTISLGATSFSFDPINPALPGTFFDHSFGTAGSTTAANDFVATNFSDPAAAYQDFISELNLAQNSWNIGFFPNSGLNFNAPGLYSISLSVFAEDPDNAFATTTILVDVPRTGNPVPEPGTLALMGAALAAFVVTRRSQAKT